MDDLTTTASLSIVLFYVGLALLFSLMSAYRTLSRLRQRAERQWAELDTLLQRRWELLARIGLSRDTRDNPVVGRISQLRQQAHAAPDRQERIAVEQEVSRLFPGGLWQGHPALADVEAQIADRRETYNAAASACNRLRRRFPALLLARALSSRDLAVFPSGFDALDEGE